MPHNTNAHSCFPSLGTIRLQITCQWFLVPLLSCPHRTRMMGRAQFKAEKFCCGSYPLFKPVWDDTVSAGFPCSLGSHSLEEWVIPYMTWSSLVVGVQAKPLDGFLCPRNSQFPFLSLPLLPSIPGCLLAQTLSASILWELKGAIKQSWKLSIGSQTENRKWQRNCLITSACFPAKNARDYFIPRCWWILWVWYP